MHICHKCNGEKYLPEAVGSGAKTAIGSRLCHECRGTGICPVCKGTGVIRAHALQITTGEKTTIVEASCPGQGRNR